MRYLGILLVSAKAFSCAFDNNKRSFYRSFNSIFGKVGRVASQEVVVQLVKTKCLPSLMYGLDACPVNNKQTKSLDFAITSSFRKIFDTKSADIVKDCMNAFNCLSTSAAIISKKCKFLIKYSSLIDNELCQLFSTAATNERMSLES